MKILREKLKFQILRGFGGPQCRPRPGPFDDPAPPIPYWSTRRSRLAALLVFAASVFNPISDFSSLVVKNDPASSEVRHRRDVVQAHPLQPLYNRRKLRLIPLS